MTSLKHVYNKLFSDAVVIIAAPVGLYDKNVSRLMAVGCDKFLDEYRFSSATAAYEKAWAAMNHEWFLIKKGE